MRTASEAEDARMALELPQQVIDRFFESNPQVLVRHHLDSYNAFFSGGIGKILREKNPIWIMKQQDRATQRFGLRAALYLGGRNGDLVYYGKPTIHDEGREHYMYPNEARLRNLTYAITIHYDVEIDYFITPPDAEAPLLEDSPPTSTTILSKIFLGRFPIMVLSDMCILKGMAPSVRFNMGECRNDYGGYFIVDGKEKCIVSQEMFADNMLYVRDKVNDLYSAAADIRSVSTDTSKPIRTVSVRIVAPTPSSRNGQIVVNVPNVRKPVPLFILMRALGVESDRSIIERCLLDMEKYGGFVDLFIPSVYDAGRVFTQETALKYLGMLTKGKTVPHALEIIADYLLPHVGEMAFQEKAYYLGYMVKELLKVHTGASKPTDRDNFRFKRVELPGSLLSNLFNEYYSLQKREIFQKIDKLYHYNQGTYSNKFTSLVETNQREIFSERLVESGFRKAFKGNWGAQEHTKRMGVVQDLNRLSYNSALSHLRKINLPLDDSAKVTGPRLLHSSQWGLIDPVDTPDGGNVGLHKHLSIATYITSGSPADPVAALLRDELDLHALSSASPFALSLEAKVFLNGRWEGVVADPQETRDKLVEARRNGRVSPYVSIHWDIAAHTIYIYTDGGRLCRPVYYIREGRPSYELHGLHKSLLEGKVSWAELTLGSPARPAAIEFMDSAEEEAALIAMDPAALREEATSLKHYTHLEIHPSLMFGVMGNQVVFPENNPLPRDLFACGQMRQAVSLYHSNFQTRIDKMGVVLNAGQTPLVKSRYLDRISHEQHPYGENVIAAIMCYGGYNVEDSILFNEGSIKRGLFRTTYYNMYESREESSKVGNSLVDTRFSPIDPARVVGTKPGFEYSDLDERGLIRENAALDEKKVVIGRLVTNMEDPDLSVDMSVYAKKGQLGYVDKAFVTEGEEGFRIAKVRVRHERIPGIGDKFCSRCGQKGTIGLVIPEEDMPFTEEGIRPDIIVNPHAFPSRMTIGQLVEVLMGKACAVYGGFGDCTAFTNRGPKDKAFGELLRRVGFNSSGNQVLYNGETGKQLEADIYIGPTYYMRLKHMVKDKINYRARGPRTVLTRQTVQGRANDGGLRIGEMERDAVISHGATKFLQESMLVRGDEYFMAVCNQTGTVAVYNDSYDLFMSPMLDGPLKFTGDMETGMHIDNVTRFGRSFSVLRVPYAFKLLLQELQTMNVQMRIITDANVDAVTNLAFSKRGLSLAAGETAPPAAATPTLPTPEAAEDAKLILTGADLGEAAKPQDMGWAQGTTGAGAGWTSLILDEDGEPTDSWELAEHDGRDPSRPPKGWSADELIERDGLKLPPLLVTQALRAIREPQNWDKALGRVSRDLSENEEAGEPPVGPPVLLVGEDTGVGRQADPAEGSVAQGSVAGQCSPGQCSPGQCSPGQCSPGQCSPGQCSPGQCSPGQCSPGQSCSGPSTAKWRAGGGQHADGGRYREHYTGRG